MNLRRGRALLLVALGVGVAAATTSGVGLVSTQAAFVDGLPVSADFTSYTVPAPATFTCGALGVLSVTFNWAAVAGATSYTLHYGTAGASTTTTSSTTATIVTAVSNGTAWVETNVAYPSTTWTSVRSTTRTYSAAAVSTCS